MRWGSCEGVFWECGEEISSSTGMEKEFKVESSEKLRYTKDLRT